ncbi:MAG: DUF5615 family PIN-like protein [Gammaproteobacteria bacterium]
MKFKVDENLPADLLDDLRVAGHEAETVPEEGLTGAPDAAGVGRKPRRGVPPNDKSPDYRLRSPAAISNAPSPPQSRG